jgi:NAD(P)-dependent dehydrogenase (short-subunit alcohol dehydrogenase family)
MWDAMLGSEKEAAIALIAKDIPMQKMGDPMDVAHAAVFLASEEAKYITGIELTIDGGLLAGAGAPVAAKDSK